jgi:hypothetical protein
MENISDNMATQKRGFTDEAGSYNKRQRLNAGDIEADRGRHTEMRGETVVDTAFGAAQSDDKVGEAETAEVKDEVSQTQISFKQNNTDSEYRSIHGPPLRRSYKLLSF